MNKRRRQPSTLPDAAPPNDAPVAAEPAGDFQLNMRFGAVTPEGEQFVLNFTMPGTEFQYLYDLIRKIGFQGMSDLLRFFSNLQQQTLIQGQLHPQQVAGQVLEELSKMDYPEPDPDRSKAKEDEVLAFTYALLRRRIIKPDQAAQYASAVLGEEISTPAWRKRLYRWADNRNIPQIEQRQARKSKKTTKPGK